MVTITLLSLAVALSLSVVIWRMVRDDRRRSEARVHALTDLAVRPELHAVRPAPAVSLSPPEHPSAWGMRAAIILCLALGVTTVVLMMLTAHTRATIAAAEPAASIQSHAAAGPLELLSMRDTRDAGTLTIAGLIRNPPAAGALRNVSVTAEAFDASGRRVAGGAAAVDVKTLQPGDESPFVLSITTAAPVARYRIGFRSADGSVIQHVDRRQQTAEAASW